MAKTKQQVKDKVEELLVNAGVQDSDAAYLADLYATSERGKEHQKSSPDPVVLGGNNCAVIGILPIG